jgi:AraC-like DNA-binding protein
MPITCFSTQNGVAVFSQRDYQTKAHAHFSIELVFSLSGSITIGTTRRQYSKIDAAIISSNIKHTFNCLNGECQLYFIDPTAAIGEQLLRDYQVEDQDLLILDTTEAENLKAKLDSTLSQSPPLSLKPERLDDRIRKCLDWIQENHALAGINLSALSDVLFLSESRLAHLFKEQVGISIHQYILWKKIEAAAKKSLGGSSLTECAHFAGFADSSHFNKTFKKMFGVKPFFALKE